MSEPRISASWLRRAHRAFLLAAVLAAALPATADWLVMGDGTKLETRGPWEVTGKLVVFTHPSGSLASLRLAEVDLEASRKATAVAAEAAQIDREAAAEPANPGAPALVITDADVSRVDPATMEARRAGLALRSQIVVYTTDWCPVCKMAKAYLTELGVAYVEKDIEKSPRAREEYNRRFGRGTGVPVLDLGGTIVRGFDSREIRQAVERLRERARLEREAARPATRPKAPGQRP